MPESAVQPIFNFEEGTSFKQMFYLMKPFPKLRANFTEAEKKLHPFRYLALINLNQSGDPRLLVHVVLMDHLLILTPTLLQPAAQNSELRHAMLFVHRSRRKLVAR